MLTERFHTEIELRLILCFRNEVEESKRDRKHSRGLKKRRKKKPLPVPINCWHCLRKFQTQSSGVIQYRLSISVCY